MRSYEYKNLRWYNNKLSTKYGTLIRGGGGGIHLPHTWHYYYTFSFRLHEIIFSRNYKNNLQCSHINTCRTLAHYVMCNVIMLIGN